MRSFIVTKKNTPLHTNTATHLHQTARSPAKALYCAGWEWSIVDSARAAIYFFVFHLYKQSSSDNRVAIEMELAATFPIAATQHSPVRALPYRAVRFTWAAQRSYRLKAIKREERKHFVISVNFQHSTLLLLRLQRFFILCLLDRASSW